MTLIRLSPTARDQLRHLASAGSNARQVRRAQVLLWLDRGDSVQAVARRLGVSRQAIYEQLKRYQARREEPILQRISDRPHTGRPPKKSQAIMELLPPLLRRDPRQLGERSSVWSVLGLWRQVKQNLGYAVSYETVRHGLELLSHRHRSAYQILARRSRRTFHRRLAKTNSKPPNGRKLSRV
jgi:transposase